MAHTTPAATRTSWTWLRVFYYQDCKDDLILDGIWPAIRAVPAADSRSHAYFKRDWLGGPNVLVGVRTDRVPPQALETVRAAIERYVADRPSRDPLTQQEFEAWARPYEQWELQPDSARQPMRPNNTVVVETTDPPSPFGYERDLTDAFRRFLADSATIVVDWLTLVRTGVCDREHIVLSALIGLLWVAEPEELRAHMSFRSHAESFFGASPAGRRLRPHFDAHYVRERAPMREFVTQTVEKLRGNLPIVPGMDAWLALLRRTLLELSDGLGTKHFTPPAMDDILNRLSHGNQALVRDALERYGGLFTLLETVPAFRAWQMTVSLTYWTLNQLGVRPMERFLAVYLLTRTAEDLYGHKAKDLADYVARTGDVRAVMGFAHARSGR